MHDVRLLGLRTRPLSGYLGALGVLRVVATQHDATATGYWDDECFVLRSALTADELVLFLADQWKPTPVFTPWNAGGGFYFRKDKTTGLRTKATTATATLERLEQSQGKRLQPVRHAISACRDVLTRLGLESPPTSADKRDLLAALRDVVPEDALAWLDAAVMVGAEKLEFPALLGSGGNDGNMDFGGSALQRLFSLFDPNDDKPTRESSGWLRATLFGQAVAGVPRATQGQFDPGNSGGANQGVGFEGKAVGNPWSFALLVEGAVAFSVSATRRLEGSAAGALSSPFSVRSVAVGYSSSAQSEEGSGRNEQWFPIWNQPATWRALSRLLSEGRAQLRRRPVAHATDFARAVATLGVDRGITAFERVGYQERNGKAHYATPLGRWQVQRRPNIDLISPALDTWLDRFRRQAADSRATGTVLRLQRRLSRGLLQLAQDDSPRVPEELLIALCDTELEVYRRRGLRDAVRPVPPLETAWRGALDTHSAEFDLAAALAGPRLRLATSGVLSTGGWAPADAPAVVWEPRSLERNLVAALRRWELVASAPSGQHPGTSPAAVADFLLGRTNDARVDGLARGLSLIRGPGAGAPPHRGRMSELPPGLLIVALAFHRRLVQADAVEVMPQTPGLLRRLERGDAAGALRAAARRLQAAGAVLRVPVHPVPRSTGQRWAAALAFPFSNSQLAEALRFITERPQTSLEVSQ